MQILHGNVTECGDVGISPGRSILLTVYHPEIGLSGDRVYDWKSLIYVRSGALMTAL